ADAVAHVIEPALVDQVDDELDLVDALEVRHLRRIAGLDEGLKTGLDERGQSAAEDRLLAEEIGLALVLEGGFDDAAARPADAARPGEAEVARFGGWVLENREQAGHAAAFFELAAHQMPGTFGRDEQHVHVLRGLDRLEMEIESVRRA